MVKYIPSLNGLRAFAIMFVLISHLPHTPYFPTFLFNVLHNLGLGTIGVRLFFILSGYLITHVLMIEYGTTGRISIKNFFTRRILRIFPSFYFYLFVLTCLSYLGIVFISIDAIFLAIFYIQNYNVWQNNEVFASSWLLKHAWSLSVEEQFYLIYPFIFKKVVDRIKGKYLLFGVGAILFGTFFRALNYSYPEVSRWLGGPFFMHADFLGIGCIIRLAYANLTKIKGVIHPYKNVFLFLSLIVAIFSSIFEYRSGINIIIFGNLILFSNSFILCYFLLYPESKVGLFLETKPLIFIGKLSYSIYVWQQLFLGSTTLWLKYNFLTYFPINLCLVFCCAILSYYLIEKPFLKLKLKFET